MCTRILYETGSKSYVTGRSMDWSDLSAQTALWIFPRGMKRDGGVGSASVQWTSQYGSVVASFYDMTTADGMNEPGLVGNMLYLAESEYGSDAKDDRPAISIGAWLQYALDQYELVADVVEAMHSDPFKLITTDAPNGKPATVHFSLSDRTGDSAIFEFIKGRLQIHHGRQYAVLTNSPIYDQQLALNAYWEHIGGENMLPGTVSAADRYVRASYQLGASPKFKDRHLAVASVFSQLRSIGVPLGMSDPDQPNIASTLWRTVSDHLAKRYYFDSVVEPSLIWVDFDKIDFSADVKKLSVGTSDLAGGEVSEKFRSAAPFEFIAP